uniref:hypothetical protein n=1 Tax=unclassified Streptomyces TaxID=2593676 RepID=UPI003F4933BD
MSETNAMEEAAGQAGQSAAVALQVLVMAAQALREHHQREAAGANARPAPAPAPAAQPQPEAKPAQTPAQRQDANPQHEKYVVVVRETVQPAAVADAMVNASQWPKLAEELRKLEAAGVDVSAFLKDAAPVIARIDADLRAGATAPGVSVAATTAPYNPWATVNPDRAEQAKPVGERIAEFVKKAVQAIKNAWQKVTGRKSEQVLGDRSQDLKRHGISPQVNTRLVVAAREALADESALAQLVTSREWPSIAGQMKQLQEAGHNPREALAGIPARIQQAAAAGISLTPAEAARGLLTEQAKTPVPVPAPATAPAVPATAASAKPAPAPAAAAAPARATAATAKSTTTAPGTTPAPGPQAAPTAATPRPAAPSQTRGR